MQERLDKGCLVIHGLTGTPPTLGPVIDGLVREGFKVNAPILPGHGTDLKDLLAIRWQGWWEGVLKAYHDLQREVKNVSCVGISLGSLLALRLAIEMRLGVKALVVMSTPLVLSGVLEYLAYPLVRFTPMRWLWRYSHKDWEGSVADPDGRAYYVKNSYDRIPVHSVLELFELKKVVRKRLCEVTSPVLVIHGRLDKVAPLRNIRLIKESVGSSEVDIMILDHSRHVVTLDYDKEIVAKGVVTFLNRFS